MSGTYVIWPPGASASGGGGGASVVGSMDAQTPSAFGATILGNTFYQQSASLTAPGLVNLVAQSFSGVKTFNSGWVSNSSVSMSSKKISNLSDPTTAQEAATKNYVDTQLSAFQPLEAVMVASVQNIPGVYLNGVAGVGATLTVSSQGAFILDGTSPTILSRVLVKDQSSGLENGVYDLTVVGAPLVSPVLTRSLDYNTPSAIDAGDLIPVIGGVVNQKTSWIQTAAVNTVGVDALTFTQYSVSPNNLPSTVGVLNGAAASLNGAVIGSSSLFLQAASAANPGLVSSASQTFAGVKTFSSAPIFNSLTASKPLRLDGSQILSNGSISLTSEVVGNLPLTQTSGSISLTQQVVGVLPLANTSIIPHQPGGQTSGSISLTQQVSGILPAANGGTGAAAFTADAVIVGSGTSALKSVSPGSAGNVLKSDGTAWVSGALATSAQAQWNYTAQSTQYSAAINDFISMSGSSTNVILPDATASGSAGKSIFHYHNGTSLSQAYTFLTTNSQSIITTDGTFTSGQVAAYTQGERWIFTSTGAGSASWVVSLHEANTPWAAYPSPIVTTGFGSISALTALWRRNTDSMLLNISWKNGTVTSSISSLTIAGGATTNISKLSATNTNLLGYGMRASNGALVPTLITTGSASSNVLAIGAAQATGSGLVPVAASNAFASNELMSFLSNPIPITGWQS